MSSTAYVFAPQVADAPWRWCLTEPDAQTRVGEGLDTLLASRDEAGTLDVDSMDVTLILPGEDALATSVSVPTRSKRQMEAALPYLVEEFVAEDIESLHLVAGAATDVGVPVQVLAPARLQARLDDLAAAGMTATSARLDHDALPASGGRVVLWIGAERALVRAPSASFAVERDQLTTLLTGLGADAEQALGFEIGVSVDADAALLMAEIEPLLVNSGSAPVARLELAATLEASIAEHLDASRGGGLELLTGPFRPSSRRTARAQRWPLAAGLLLGWFLLQSGLDTAKTGWLEARTESLRAENMELFQDLVPGRTRSPDPRRELEAMLGDTGGGGTSFLTLLGAVAAEVAGLGGSVELRSINWNQQRGDLALDLSLPGIAQVDKFKAQLESVGFPVTIDSAVQEQSGVRARIRVGGGADT